MERVNEIRALIYGKYKNEAALARELSWSRQRLNKITNGDKEPDLAEVEALAEKLDQPIEKIFNIFLRRRSPIG